VNHILLLRKETLTLRAYSGNWVTKWLSSWLGHGFDALPLCFRVAAVGYLYTLTCPVRRDGFYS